MYEAAQHARAGDIDYFRNLAPQEIQVLIVGRDEDGRTLLHTAAAGGHTALVELLAEGGAGKVVNKQDDEVRLGFSGSWNQQLGASSGTAPCHHQPCSVCQHQPLPPLSPQQRLLHPSNSSPAVC